MSNVMNYKWKMTTLWWDRLLVILNEGIWSVPELTTDLVIHIKINNFRHKRSTPLLSILYMWKLFPLLFNVWWIVVSKCILKLNYDVGIKSCRTEKLCKTYIFILKRVQNVHILLFFHHLNFSHTWKDCQTAEILKNCFRTFPETATY